MSSADNTFPAKDFMHHDYKDLHHVPVPPFFIALIILLLVAAVFVSRFIYKRFIKWRSLAMIAPASDIEMQPVPPA
jgi:hypothetical protein